LVILFIAFANRNRKGRPSPKRLSLLIYRLAEGFPMTPIVVRIYRALLPAALVGAAWLIAIPANAQEAVCAPVVTTEIAPPPLPAYDQPPLPAPGYIWTPGYWSWDEDEADYYWVPGTWVDPPRPGFLWTPGYWAWFGGQYLFHQGYWGPRVGFYGGIAYGFGYTGEGYEGGRWDHGAFYYNRTVNNLEGAPVRNVYEKTVVVNNAASGVSFNGGKNGTIAKPTTEERAYDRENHFAPTGQQQQHVQLSAKDPNAFEKSNQGKPPVAATSKPGELKGPGVTPAAAVGGGQRVPPPPSGEIKPAPAAVAPSANLPPGELKKPQIGGPPAAELKKPPAGGSIPTGSPPAAPPLNPAANEIKKPPTGGPGPAPKPQFEARPQPQPQAVKPPPPQAPSQIARPPSAPPPGGGHPPARAQEKKKEQGKKPEDK
jgi:WXXGXW repeat (2 copies)